MTISIREDIICRTLTDWAGRLDLPVTVGDLAAVAVEIDRNLRHTEPRRRPAIAPGKPGATPDDARRIAARLEATYQSRSTT